MSTYFSNPRRLLLFLSILIISCSKSSDPAPLGAQTNAKLLAGEAGKSKGWKLTEIAFSTGTAPLAAATGLDPCFMDNIYTFSNNAAQSYVGAEGSTKCDPADPATFESGSWAFTLDGFTLNIECNASYAPNGLFSSEVYALTGANGPVGYNFGIVPYPMSVTKLDASNMVLQVTETYGASSTKYNYRLTFFAP